MPEAALAKPVARKTAAVRPEQSTTVRRSSSAPGTSPGLPLFLQPRLAPSANGLTLQRKCTACAAPDAPTSGDLVQRSVTIGAPNDRYEQEADRAATAVTSGKAAPPVSGMRASVARSVREQEDDGLASRISAPTGGRPLSDSLRTDMEAAFGADFSAVRIHDTAEARTDAKALGARAFTHRSGIWLGPGGSANDRGLVAHELTHVLQQGAAVRRKPVDAAGDGSPPRSDLPASDVPDVQAAWYNFDIPFTDYQFDPSIRGVKNAAGIAKDTVVDTAVWAKDKAVSAFQWVFDKIKGLVTTGIDWLNDKFDAIKEFATSSFETVRSKLTDLLGLITSPAALVTQAFALLSTDLLAAAWNGLKTGVATVWKGIRATVDTVLGIGNGLWKTASGFVSGLFGNIRRVMDSWPFRQLPGFLQRAARRLFEELQDLWHTVRDFLTHLLKRLNDFVQGLLTAIGNFFEKVVNFGIQKVVDTVRAIREAWQFVKKVAADPEGFIRPTINELAGKINAESPPKAASLGEEKLREHFQPNSASSDGQVVIQRVPSGAKPTRSTAGFWEVLDGFTSAISQAWSTLDVRQMLWETVVNMFWPPATIRAIGHEFSELWNTDWANAVGGLFAPRAPWDDFVGFFQDLWSNLLVLLDFPLALWRRLNNVLMLLLGYVTIILVIVGAVAGGIAGAAAGGVGAIPGAAAGALAGLKIAGAAGLFLLKSYLLAEGVTVVKGFLDLFTARQTEAEKQRDYVQIAGSLIGMGFAVVIVALLYLLSALVASVVRLVRGAGKAKPPPPPPAEKAAAPAAEPVQPPKASKPAEPPKPAEAPKPAKPAEPPRPAEPSKPPKPAEPAEPARPGKKPKPEPAKAQDPVTPVEGQPNVFRVNDVSALKATEPVRANVVADRALWRWELYVELPNGQRAVFCEVNLRPSPFGGTSPDLNLHPATSTVKGGAPVKLQLPSGGWTTEALRLMIDSYRRKFGHAPKNLGGWLAEKNLQHFQAEYAKLRAQHPGLSSSAIGEMAIRMISFGQHRIGLGYEHFRVTVFRFGKKTVGGKTEVVPTEVRVEASKTPIPSGTIPPAVPEVEVPEAGEPEGEGVEELELVED